MSNADLACKDCKAHLAVTQKLKSICIDIDKLEEMDVTIWSKHDTLKKNMNDELVKRVKITTLIAVTVIVLSILSGLLGAIYSATSETRDHVIATQLEVREFKTRLMDHIENRSQHREHSLMSNE